MKVIGFFQEIMPNGQVSNSSGRLNIIIVIAAAIALMFGYAYRQQQAVTEQTALMQKMVKVTTIMPVNTEIGKTVVTEQPVLSPIEFRENLKTIPGIPWEGVLTLIGLALGYGGYSKTKSLVSLAKDTPDKITPDHVEPAPQT